MSYSDPSITTTHPRATGPVDLEETTRQHPRSNPVALNLYSPTSRGAFTRFLLSPPDLEWSPAGAFGIQRSTDPEVWHAGHVNAIVADGPVVLVGAETGGLVAGLARVRRDPAVRELSRPVAELGLAQSAPQHLGRRS